MSKENSGKHAYPYELNPIPKAGIDAILWYSLCGWLIPGAGHWMAGMRKRAYILAAIVMGSFLFGLILSSFTAVSTHVHPFAYYAHLGVGSYTLAVASQVTQNLGAEEYRNVSQFHDIGVLFCSIAGLLNILTLLDLGDRLLGYKATEFDVKKKASK